MTTINQKNENIREQEYMMNEKDKQKINRKYRTKIIHSKKQGCSEWKNIKKQYEIKNTFEK